MNSNPLRKFAGTTFAYAVLIAVGLVMIFPFLWMASTSLKSLGEAFAYPPTFLPKSFRWENYTKLFETAPLAEFFMNSVKITTLTVVGITLSSAMAAFALAQLNFPGKRPLFMGTLATLMVPYQVTLIPVFIMFQAIGWKNSHYPLWVPAFFGSAFGVFLLRQFFLSVPRELYEAASIDGCSPGRILFQIHLPLARPAVATLAVFSFMNSWNDLLNPLIYIDTMEMMPLTAGLSFLQTSHGSNWPMMMAGAMMSILPILVIFTIAQRSFIEGIATSGLK